MKTLIGDLNQLYTSTPALYSYEFEPQGFEWLDCNDREQSILSYIRKDGDQQIISLFNFTPVPRKNYRIGVPEAGTYEILLNSDSEFYGGSNLSNPAEFNTQNVPWSDRAYSIELNLPPLAGLVLRKK